MKIGKVEIYFKFSEDKISEYRKIMWVRALKSNSIAMGFYREEHINKINGIQKSNTDSPELIDSTMLEPNFSLKKINFHMNYEPGAVVLSRYNSETRLHQEIGERWNIDNLAKRQNISHLITISPRNPAEYKKVTVDPIVQPHPGLTRIFLQTQRTIILLFLIVKDFSNITSDKVVKQVSKREQRFMLLGNNIPFNLGLIARDVPWNWPNGMRLGIEYKRRPHT